MEEVDLAEAEVVVEEAEEQDDTLGDKRMKRKYEYNYQRTIKLSLMVLFILLLFSLISANTIYTDAAETMKEEQNSTLSFGYNFILFIDWVFVLSPIPIIIFLYLKFGREQEFPELNTLPIYVRDISEIGNISPAEAAVLLDPDVAETGLNKVISAEIMELIRLGYLEVIEKEKSNGIKSDIIEFKPVEGKDINRLTPIQRKLYEFIKYHLINNTFSFEEYGKKIKTDNQARNEFKKFVLGLKHNINKLLNEKYIDKTGLKLGGIFTALYGMIFGTYFISSLKPEDTSHLIFIGLITFLISAYFILHKKSVLSRWTKEGRIAHEKLKRYKKFIEEMTTIEKKDIKDVILWEKLLVYAAALGVANNVINSMKIHYPDLIKNRITSYLLIIPISFEILESVD